ncbi:MAG: hypothetical protein V1773_04280 [bacterium]
MYRLITIIVILFSFLSQSYSQTLDEYSKKIDSKLRRDKNYLNLNYLDITPDFQNIPQFNSIFPRVDGREPFTFASKENITYRLVYLKNGLDIDSVYLLYLVKIERDVSSEQGLIVQATTDQKEDISRVLNFKDIYSLKINQPPLYSFLLALVNSDVRDKEESDTRLPSLLGITPDEEIKTSIGMSSRDNRDYYNYVTVNTAAHWYPRETAEVQTKGRIKTTVSDLPYKIDASFSHISFSHQIMEFKNLGGASVELSTEERVLNLLPWESMLLGVGAKLLFRLDDGKNIYTSTYIDAKLMARLKMSKKTFLDGRYIAENNPFGPGETPMLNLSNSISCDLSFTRPMSLPFMNLYFSIGSEEFKDPNVYIKSGTGYVGYHTSTQAEMTFSFFWNSSEKFVNRFGMDVGAAYYNIWEAKYDIKLNFKGAKLVQDKFMPVVVFHYNFVPKGEPLLGGSVRLFDSHANVSAWLKLIDISSIHRFRFEVSYLTAPFARQRRAWESEGGAMFQLRYRLGIN